MVPESLKSEIEMLEIEGQIETILALLGSTRYWKESWKLDDTCCHSNSRES